MSEPAKIILVAGQSTKVIKEPSMKPVILCYTDTSVTNAFPETTWNTHVFFFLDHFLVNNKKLILFRVN